MRGHIRRRSKGSWEITVDIGRDPVTGKRLRHFESIRGAKKDAERRLRELLHSLEHGGYAKPIRITLGAWLNGWLNSYVKTKCSLRTLDGYNTIVERHLTTNLGMIPLSQLRPQHIQEFYAHALEDGRVDGKGGLSARSVLHIHRILFQALNYAVRQGLLISNPAGFVDPPRAKKPKMKALIPQEVAVLLDVARDTRYYPIIYAAVNTGLRQAELLGLRWRDTDLELASLSITQVLCKVIPHRRALTLRAAKGLCPFGIPESGNPVPRAQGVIGNKRRGVCQFKEPKSEHSRRRLDLTPSLAIFLRQYRVEKETEFLLLGKRLGENDLVFGDISGSPIDPGTLTHNFARIVRRAGLPGVRFHDLRHTFASLMLLAGVHPKIVSEMLGHSSVAFTLDVYSHVVDGLQKTAVKRLDEVLKPEATDNQYVGKMSAREVE